MPSVLITGGTSGLGLAAARAAAQRADVLVAGPDRRRVEQAARAVGGDPVVLDLASLDDVGRVAADLPPLDAVACNAGVQLPGPLATTVDGFEHTFQVNHLAHLALLDGLSSRTARAVLVGSATHDPAQRTGMPAPPDIPVEALALGGTRDEDDRHAGRRRYTTSKLLVTAIVPALARAHPDLHVTCLDPGLMLTTGLVRHYPPAVRRLLSLLDRPVGALPFASTPQVSGALLASLLLDPPSTPSGAVIDHRGRRARVSRRAADRTFQAEVLAVSRRLVATAPRRQSPAGAGL